MGRPPPLPPSARRAARTPHFLFCSSLPLFQYASKTPSSWDGSAIIQKHLAVRSHAPQQDWSPQRGLPEKTVSMLKAWIFWFSAQVCTSEVMQMNIFRIMCMGIFFWASCFCRCEFSS